MIPVATTTGAVRLEDTKAARGLAADCQQVHADEPEAGQRMADECMSPEQYVAAEAIKKAPAERF